MTTSKHQSPPKDEPVRNAVPTFLAPPQSTSPSSTALEEGPPTETLERVAEGLRILDEPPRHRSLLPRRDPANLGENPGPSRTESSTPGENRAAAKPTAEEATGLVIGVLAIVTTAAAAIIRWRLNRKLREPTKTQRGDIARPLARILLRHANAIVLGEDIPDALQAAGAIGAYAGDGPLLLPVGPDIDPNIPPTQE